MPKFKFTFKHIEESTYVALIESDTLEEAKTIFNDAPFDHLEDEDPIEVQGTDTEIEEIEEL
jgi:hypothetical protein